MKNKSLFRASLFGLTLAIVITLVGGVGSVRAWSFQPSSPQTAERFAGTWNWMFGGKSFATMILTPSGTGFEGTVTESRIALNDDGTLKKAEASDDKTPKQITQAEFDGKLLHVTVVDGFAFTVSLRDNGHADLLPVGAPPNMKPISLIKEY